MNYIKTIFTILLLVPCALVFGQNTDVKTELTSAKTSYNNGNLEDARFALERSLNELNNVIALEIKALIPDMIGGIPAFNPDDETIGNTGGAGIFVSRTYKNEDAKKAEMTISDHSPMIAMVNSFLSNSVLSNIVMAESDQKSIKVSGYKGMLEKTEGDTGGVRYVINVPFGDSLLTLETDGINSEDDAIKMASEIPLDQISELVK